MDSLTLRAEDIGALTPEVLQRVAQGESVAITRAGMVVAKVVATAPVASTKQGLSERLRQHRDALSRKGQGLTHQQIHELRNDHSA